MKAALFYEHGGSEKITVADIPQPAPQKGEALVRVKACALNHLDIWIRNGIAAYKTKLPHISGCDISGEIAALGSGVRGFKPGEKVMVAPGISCRECEFCKRGDDNLCESFTILGAGTDGGFAEYVCVPARNVFRIPKGISFEEVAAFPLTFLTSWHMLSTRAKLRKGETLLVLGAGSGIGSAAVAIGRFIGARIFATVGLEEKISKAKALGAHEVINHTTQDFSREIRRLTEGKGADVIFEHVGPATWQKSILSLKKGGRLVTCGATTGPMVELDLRYVFSRQLSIFGSIMGTRAEFVKLVSLLANKKLKPVIDRVFPLSEARAAYDYFESRRLFGKVLISPFINAAHSKKFEAAMASVVSRHGRTFAKLA